MSLAVVHRNEIVLVGRVETEPVVRSGAGGRPTLSWRLAVQRPVLGDGQRASAVDSLDCVALAAGLRSRIAGWQPGDLVHVDGALRRRFWRGADGVRSRYEVEVLRARRISRAPAQQSA